MNNLLVYGLPGLAPGWLARFCVVLGSRRVTAPMTPPKKAPCMNRDGETYTRWDALHDASSHHPV